MGKWNRNYTSSNPQATRVWPGAEPRGRRRAVGVQSDTLMGPIGPCRAALEERHDFMELGWGGEFLKFQNQYFQHPLSKLRKPRNGSRWPTSPNWHPNGLETASSLPKRCNYSGWGRVVCCLLCMCECVFVSLSLQPLLPSTDDRRCTTWETGE